MPKKNKTEERKIKDLTQYKVTIELYFPTWHTKKDIVRYFKNCLGHLKSIKVEKLKNEQ